MTGSNKAYSAPRLEVLSLRETRDITIQIGVGGSVTIPTGALS